MTFLNGILAFGAIAALVPLLIHLFNRSRFKVVAWGAIHLLESVLRKNRKQIQLEQERLISYIQKSYKARIKWVKQGKIDQVICSEIGACLAAGRMDLVENLVSRKARLQSLNSLVDQMEYQRRFRNDEVILPPEESLEKENGITTLNTDSTQKQ